MAVDLGCDEGGAGDTLLVSAQMAVTEQARKLKRQWISALGNVAYFHSKDLGNFSAGVFTDAGLDRSQREELLKKLHKIIHRHLTLGITAKISKKLYDSLTTNEFRSKWGTAYTFAVNMCLLAAHLEFTKRGDESNFPWPAVDINILLESGHRHCAQALEFLNNGNKIPLKKRFVTILSAGLGNKKDHPILQAADMLAYSEWQEICDRPSPLHWVMYRESSRYRAARLECTAELIEGMNEGALRWIEHKRRHWHENRRHPVTAPLP